MKKQITSELFKEYINIRDFKPNGGKLFSFIEDKTDLEYDKYISNLFLFDMEKEEILKQLTFENSVGLHQWIDEETMIITGARDDEDKAESDKGIPQTVFYKFNVHTGEYTKLFKIYKDLSAFQYIDEERYLLLADENPMRDEYLEEAGGDWDKYLKIVERESRYFIADEVPFWTNGSGYANKDRGRVYLYDHGELKLLTDDSISVWEIDSYKDEFGVFWGVESGGVQRTEGKLYKVNYADGSVSPIDDSNNYIYTKAEILDSDHVLVLRNDRAFHGEYQDEYVDILELSTGKFSRNNKKTDIHIYSHIFNDLSYKSGYVAKFTPYEDGLIYMATERAKSDLYFSLVGDDEMKQLTFSDGYIMEYVLYGDKAFVSAFCGTTGCELYVCDLLDGGMDQITDYNGHIEEAYDIPEIEECGFVNSDGVQIDGWVIKPIGMEEGKKYPAILFIHGGPNSVYSDIVSHDMMLMAQNGWGVFYCNPRGSESYGGDFADIRTIWGTVDYADFMEFTDTVLERHPWVDETRLGVTGGSYGGIMTNWIIGHTDRFKAAISDRSATNMISDYGLCDIAASCGVDTYGTTPWENIDFLWEQSPLKYAPNIKTPVLFIHGVDDFRCPFDHALQLHSAITYFGGISKVFGVKGANHGLCCTGKPQARKRRLEEMEKWFKKYL